MGNAQFIQDIPIVPGLMPALPVVIYQSATQYSEGDATTENIAALNIPKDFLVPGTTFRVTITGTKTGANAAMSVQLSLGSTAVLTMALDDATAVDFTAVMHIHIAGMASQKCFGWVLSDTADPGADYAAGTVNVGDGAILYVQMTNGHASDEITCEFCMVEMWKK